MWTLVIGHGLLLTAAGIGIAGALVVTRAMSGLLFGVSPTDPATFAGVSALLVIVASIACWLPARGRRRAWIRKSF